MFHYYQNLSSNDAGLQFDDFCHSHKSNASLISSLPDYDVGYEWDLFKAPQPLIEQPLFTLDHTTSAMSMILCGDDFISQEIEFSDIELLQNEDFTSNVFYEYNDILSNESSSPSQAMNSNSIIVKENWFPTGNISKNLSSDCLISMDEAQIRPNSGNFTEMGLNNVHGIRRVLSEEYIKPQFISNHTTETRMEKLSRYRDKKTKRNFRRKIKYACRKALADGQPRIKGRFAKTEETDNLRM